MAVSLHRGLKVAEVTRLTKKVFREALGRLAERDVDLARVLSRWGEPPFWRQEPGYPTLVHLILTQQVSLASADAAYSRLTQTAQPLSPENFLLLDNLTLRKVGFSRQKADYVQGLSRMILEGNLDLEGLSNQDDEVVREILMKVKGIGLWTADNYLLMALCRQDVWPVGDLALAEAVRMLKNLHDRPDGKEMSEFGEVWRPWRAVAARVLWHYYLSEKGQVVR